MAQHQLTHPDTNWSDKRRGTRNDNTSHKVGPVTFTANAAGTTTTIKGADGVLTTGVNVVRIGERGKIFTSAGAVREETVVTITAASSATGTTTLTFSPAIGTATASGDVFRPVANPAVVDNSALDTRLNAFNSTLYSQANLDKMTQNDKVYALRLIDDPTSF